MNPVLQEIFETKTVRYGAENLPLDSNVSHEEGLLIERAFHEVKPTLSLEVGMAYGISTLFICDAIAAHRTDATHIVIDPFQRSYWRGIGMKNVTRAGYEHIIDLHEVKSEIELPSLLAAGTQIQAAFIDGWHTFDHTLVDFFYVNKMLAVGGIVIIDDTNMPAIRRVADHILTYPAYRLFGVAQEDAKPIKTRLRRKLAKIIGTQAFTRDWDFPSAMAFQKITADDRNWDWHEPF